MSRLGIALSLIASVTTIGCSGCRRRGSSGDGGADAPPPANVPLPPFERFVAARPRGDGDFDVAAVARDNTIVLARVDDTLHARAVTVLASSFTATEDTSLALLPGGAVIVEGRIADRLGTFLLDTSASKDPVAVGADWCEVARGAAWLVRDPGEAGKPGGLRVHFHRAALDGGAPVDAQSGLVATTPEQETHLDCGPDAVVVAMRDGEDLSVVRMKPNAPDFATPAAPTQIEQENQLEDELRDRFVDVRAGEEVVVVRVGEGSVYLTTWGEQRGNWIRIDQLDAKGKARRWKLDDDADVIDVEPSPHAGAPIYMLVSEPMMGECKDGDPPRRIVLHSIVPPAPNGEGAAIDTRHPIVELACGVEAIAAHLTVDGASDAARLWWTEPVADGSCPFPGLGVGAVVEARSDAPGAKRHAILAEGAGAAGDGKWVAVVRAGGCADYAAAGNGAIEWVP